MSGSNQSADNKEKILTEAGAQEPLNAQGNTDGQTPANENEQPSGLELNGQDDLEAKLAALSEENIALQSQLKGANETIARLTRKFDLADLAMKDEIAKSQERSKEEVEKAKLYGVTKLAKDILSIADSFELAAKAITPEKRAENPDMEQQAQSYEVMHGQLVGILKRHGIEKIEALDQKFDTNFHEAVTMLPTEPGKDANTVGYVFENGYTLNGRLLRAAKVGIRQG